MAEICKQLIDCLVMSATYRRFVTFRQNTYTFYGRKYILVIDIHTYQLEKQQFVDFSENHFIKETAVWLNNQFSSHEYAK